MFDWSSLRIAIVSLFWAIFAFSRSALLSWYSNCPPIIRRYQLFEFHDLSWFPHFLRVLLTNNLREMWRFDSYYKRTLSLLLSVIHTIESKTVPDRTSSLSKLRTIEHPVLVDLCSGSGGPIVDIQRSLARGEGGKGKGQLGIDVDWILTDLYPNITAFKASSLASLKDRLVGHHYTLDYNSSSIDATKCELKSDMRTVFGAFHHFSPATARLILKDAFVSRTPLSIIEATERSLYNMYTFPFFSFVFSYLAPFLAPFSIAHFFFTFFIPILPFLQVFDGFISILRCYSPQEIIAFIEGIEGVGKKEWTVKEECVEGEKGESVWYQECQVPIEDGKQYVWRVGVKKAPWYKISTVNMVFYQGYITASS